MPFSFHRDYLEPEHLDLLTQVFNRIVGGSASELDELDRHGIASRLLAAFAAGRRDADDLFRFASPEEEAA